MPSGFKWMAPGLDENQGSAFRADETGNPAWAPLRRGNALPWNTFSAKVYPMLWLLNFTDGFWPIPIRQSWNVFPGWHLSRKTFMLLIGLSTYRSWQDLLDPVKPQPVLRFCILLRRADQACRIAFINADCLRGNGRMIFETLGLNFPILSIWKRLILMPWRGLP